jgi:hypothetical protein
MALSSEILSRVYEENSGPYPDLSNLELIRRFDALDNELNLIRTLTGLNTAKTEATRNRNTILVFKPNGDLEVFSYRDSTEALDDLFRLENENPDLDIVLVKADTSEEIRMAFKNYFSDAKDFVRLLTRAKEMLREPLS